MRAIFLPPSIPARTSSLSAVEQPQGPAPALTSAYPTAHAHASAIDPYRVFFPLGILMGIAGVGIWPLYHFGLIETFSGRAHAFIQIGGFLFSFIAGFLLTAIPRLTKTAVPGRGVQAMLAALITTSVVGFEIGHHRLGHTAFLFGYLGLVSQIIPRFRRRQSRPPESFALVGLGLFMGLAGVVINTLIAWEYVSAARYTLGMRLLTEGMVLSLVMGVGGFLEPRIFGWTAAKVDSQGRPIMDSDVDRGRMIASFFAGLALAVSIVAEHGFDIPSAVWLRTLAVSAYVLKYLSPFRAPAHRTTTSRCLRFTNLMILSAVWLMALAPAYLVDMMHMMLMGGFSLLILAVATRVALAHGGHDLAAEKSSWPLRIGIACVVLGLGARVGAPFVLESYFLHLALAGLLWITGLLFWGAYLCRLILLPRR